MTSTDFQAIVLAGGRGSRLTELIESSEHSTPKCLLPVVDKPMIYYPINALVQADFVGKFGVRSVIVIHQVFPTDILVIVPDVHEKQIADAINSLFPSVNFELFPIPSSDELGTAESLRLAANKIKSDFVVVSCDAITDYPLLSLINEHRTHEPDLIALISNVKLPMPPGDNQKKAKSSLERDLIAIDTENDNRLVFLSSEADYEEVLTVKMSTISRCPNVVIKTNYLDAHIYTFRKWIIDFLRENT